MSRLLVKEKKGKSYRLYDCDEEVTLRAFARDFPDVDFIEGTVFICYYDATGDLLESLTVQEEILGDSEKSRAELLADEYKVGDLYDGVPIFGFGKKYAKKGKKYNYAYFK